MNDNATLRDVETWLTRSLGQPPAEEIQAIRRHLAVLAKEPPFSAQRQQLLDGLYVRTNAAVETLLPRLYNVRLPISNNTRQTVRAMQEALDGLARLGLDTVESPDSQLIKGLGTPTEIVLGRIIEALTQYFTLANLIASPAGPGIWLKLHRAYLATRRHRAETRKPHPQSADLQTLYGRALISGSLTPSALNANEWAFLHRFLTQSKTALTVLDAPPANTTEPTLWTSPQYDFPPTLIDRRPPGDEPLTIFIRCTEILAEIKDALSVIMKPTTKPAFLPVDVSPRTARIALQRLREHLSTPRKRRFPRRRQGYRSTLCVGFEEICLLLKTGIEQAEALSEWMVVNESPGGYAAMHVAGRPKKAQVGDLVAMRREGEAQWGISVVRWALSENPEHLEFGLEELSPHALSGYMATPGHEQSRQALALLLPALPPIRESDALAFSPASRPSPERHHIFVCDGEKVEIREFRLGKAIEQSSGIDVCLISPNKEP